MDRTKVRNFAVWARTELIDRVKRQAERYGCSASGTVEAVKAPDLKTERQLRQLKENIRKKGFGHVMEETAYTWFNRFIRLRYLEANGYLPGGRRVFTDESGDFAPGGSCLMYSEEEYRSFVIDICNEMSRALPNIFERISDPTELLFPSGLLDRDSFISRMTEDISEDDWKEDVRIIGWLYQYYNEERKNSVISLNNPSVSKEDIPAATQLFTNEWVVRYVLDNSLGRYWVERNPESPLKDTLEYLVLPETCEWKTQSGTIEPEELTVLDPCMGSGHFLLYAFDILIQIYSERGYTSKEAARSIVKNNLYGLDIDDRAGQLASFAVMMKARQYDPDILDGSVSPNTLAFVESSFMDDLFISYFAGKDKKIRALLEQLREAFRDAKELGSIINIGPFDPEPLYSRAKEMSGETPSDLLGMLYRDLVSDKLIPLIRQAEALFGRYCVVATNPPFLSKMNSVLKTYVKKHYTDYSGDLFSVFMYRNFGLCREGGYSGFMSPFVWMFIRNYEKLRKYILENKAITTLVQMEYSAFEDATVPICTFVLKNGPEDTKGCYFRLSDFPGGMDVQKQKVLHAIADRDCGYYYEVTSDAFAGIPGRPVAYWVGKAMARAFREGTPLSEAADLRQGLATTDNNRFLRLWYEVDYKDIVFGMKDTAQAEASGGKWFPYNKGGDFRKWYGNDDYVVDYSDDGREIKESVMAKYPYLKTPGFVVKNTGYYFKECISWSLISSAATAFRYKPEGFIFDVAGMSLFTEEDLYYYLGFCNTKIAYEALKIIAPTINFQVGDIARLPFIKDDSRKDEIAGLVQENIEISKEDWDAYETSWGFKKDPLVGIAQKSGLSSISDCFGIWEKECASRFEKLKSNEEKLNSIFIDIYGMEGEMTPEVEDRQVTVRKAGRADSIKNLMSYALGCVFGRYSPETDGVLSDVSSECPVAVPLHHDGVSRDIVRYIRGFLSEVFGAESLERNMRYIAESLGGAGSPEEVISAYFKNEFFKDHCRAYSVTGSGRRPIYWLFDSGRKNGFKCLVYMHSFKPEDLESVSALVGLRMDFCLKALRSTENALSSPDQRERSEARRNRENIKKILEEIEAYGSEIKTIISAGIRLDKDDGITANYSKLKKVLAKIK